MKKILTFLILVLAFNSIKVSAQKTEIKSWNYNINIDYKDSTLFINLNLEAYKTENWKRNYFLFNRYIKIEKAFLNNIPLKYTRSNDTLYIESSNENENEINIYMQYKIPCSYNESLKITKAFSDSTFAYPVQFDSDQIFCERYSKYFPFIYDNFSNYTVNITVPKTYQVYAEHNEINNKSTEDRNCYTYKFFDEDFRFLITKSNIFPSKKLIKNNNTYLKFNFLPSKKRLLSYLNKKPKYITDSIQMDSLYNVIANRSAQALIWYNTNLWEQRFDTLNFVETKIPGLAVNLHSFILFDRSLMNMEVIDNYAFSHEIGHLWVGYNIKYLSKGFYFLSESINEYNNLLFYESWAGETAFENAIKDKINMHYSDKPFFTASFEQVLNQKNGDLKYEMIYCKGVVFAHEFCKMIGKEKYLKIIRDAYYNPNHYITLADFEKSIKKNGCWDKYMKLYKLKL